MPRGHADKACRIGGRTGCASYTVRGRRGDNGAVFVKGLHAIVYKKVVQVVSELVGRCESSVECLVWSRAIDQCAKCVVEC